MINSEIPVPYLNASPEWHEWGLKPPPPGLANNLFYKKDLLRDSQN